MYKGHSSDKHAHTELSLNYTASHSVPAAFYLYFAAPVVIIYKCIRQLYSMKRTSDKHLLFYMPKAQHYREHRWSQALVADGV